MTYGITGNTQKEKLWKPAADLVHWLAERDLAFCLHQAVAQGLAERGLAAPSLCSQHTEADLASAADVILSFGGDGTMLRSAHEVGNRETPILGVNIGRLGFLADIEVEELQQAIELLEQGQYRIEPRMVLQATIEGAADVPPRWALNEFVLERSGPAGLISLHVTVDGEPLNEYWSDGLIIATPTGSTAYSLSVGGPIVMPGSDVLILTPVAPHSLTVRPIVLPASARVHVQMHSRQEPFVLAADGESTSFNDEITLTIQRADHVVNLVKLPEQHYFQTIRSKLMWGIRKQR